MKIDQEDGVYWAFGHLSRHPSALNVAVQSSRLLRLLGVRKIGQPALKQMANHKTSYRLSTIQPVTSSHSCM